MGAHNLARMGVEARAVVSMFQELGRQAMLERAHRSSRYRRARTKLTLPEGAPASVQWCRDNLSPLRGIGETTLLPVGHDLEQLRYGLACLRKVQAKGHKVAWPIAYVLQRAERVKGGF